MKKAILILITAALCFGFIRLVYFGNTWKDDFDLTKINHWMIYSANTNTRVPLQPHEISEILQRCESAKEVRNSLTFSIPINIYGFSEEPNKDNSNSVIWIGIGEEDMDLFVCRSKNPEKQIYYKSPELVAWMHGRYGGSDKAAPKVPD